MLDVEHVLVRFRARAYYPLVYRCVAEYLVEQRGNAYARAALAPESFDFAFGARGLVFDVATGDLVRLDARGRVIAARHGAARPAPLAAADVAARHRARGSGAWPHFGELRRGVARSKHYVLLLSPRDVPLALLLARMVDAADGVPAAARGGRDAVGRVDHAREEERERHVARREEQHVVLRARDAAAELAEMRPRAGAARAVARGDVGRGERRGPRRAVARGDHAAARVEPDQVARRDVEDEPARAEREIEALGRERGARVRVAALLDEVLGDASVHERVVRARAEAHEDVLDVQHERSRAAEPRRRAARESKPRGRRGSRRVARSPPSAPALQLHHANDDRARARREGER